MKREEKLEQTLKKLITQTNKALDEGWIYTGDFRQELAKAQEILSFDNEKKTSVYPEPKPNFHVINQ